MRGAKKAMPVNISVTQLTKLPLTENGQSASEQRGRYLNQSINQSINEKVSK